MGSGLCLAASLQSSGLCIPGAVQGFKGRCNMEYCRVTVSLAHTDPAGPSLLLEVPLGAHRVLLGRTRAFGHFTGHLRPSTKFM